MNKIFSLLMTYVKGCVPPFTQGQVLCVKGGTHPFFCHEGTKFHEVSLWFLCVFVSLWLIFSDV
ncbi:Uncharacterized protein dnm_070560 [Desulfonema magnum]|uniref:Uncharacterized protein n=1 Tax=Desulfonema magnum TaxID=45655 RepID=A0A975BT42_9BACT|nr:Uncharacterized protein dnm_070560 [Desulfonema magnum]